MQLDKQQIVNMLKSQLQSGDRGQADQAEQQLPQQVDTDNPQHQQLLQKFGINLQDLIGRLGGGIPGMQSLAHTALSQLSQTPKTTILVETMRQG